MNGTGIVVLDVETTGLSADGGDRVVELGLVRLDDELRVEREYSTLVNPERPMGASSIHGIRDIDVQDAPTFGDIAGDVGEFCADAILAAHNAPFDLRFLFSEFEHVGLAERLPLERLLSVIDTLELSRSLITGVPNYKLTTVCEACGVPPWTHHGALGDARATAQLLARLSQVGGGLPMPNMPVVLDTGWTGLAPSGLVRPRRTLAALAKPGGEQPVAANRPPPLAGEVAVFTGGVGIARDEAVKVAEALGCVVRPAVSGKTTIVVVGDPDVGRFAADVGTGASGKHRAALERAAAGQRLRVLDEAAFMRLAEVVSDGVITEGEWHAVRELVYAVGFAEPAPKRRPGRPRKTAPVEVKAEVPGPEVPKVDQAAAEGPKADTPVAGPGRPCKTTGCKGVTATKARQYCEECRDIRVSPNTYRHGDARGSKLFFSVAGVTHYPASRRVRPGEQLFFQRDPGNVHDPLAIEVRRSDGGMVGYVPRGSSLEGRFGNVAYTQADLAQALDAGSNYRLECYAAGGAVQVKGYCDGWMVPYPARLEAWGEQASVWNQPRPPLPFNVAPGVEGPGGEKAPEPATSQFNYEMRKQGELPTFVIALLVLTVFAVIVAVVASLRR